MDLRNQAGWLSAGGCAKCHSAMSWPDPKSVTENAVNEQPSAGVPIVLSTVVSPRISFRLVEATYLLTTVNKGVNQRQNNLRLSAGIVMHF
jgi:hypothetical protein